MSVRRTKEQATAEVTVMMSWSFCTGRVRGEDEEHGEGELELLRIWSAATTSLRGKIKRVAWGKESVDSGIDKAPEYFSDSTIPLSKTGQRSIIGTQPEKQQVRAHTVNGWPW